MLLAEADAFRSFGLDRREGLWAVRRLPDDKPLPLFAPRAAPEQGTETIAPLPAMPLSEHVLADYQTTRLSLKGYPTQFLRPGYQAEGITACADVGKLRDGAKATVLFDLPGAESTPKAAAERRMAPTLCGSVT